jgi:primosomal protein N' (replication factor Y) (superfamily II helicase)
LSAPRFARVAVNITQLSGLFDYAIPEEWQDQVKPGSLVTIPFGRQLTQGIVVVLTDDPAVPNPKPLDSVLEKEAVVTPQQIKLAQWMSEENLTGLSACLDMMLPPGLSQHADILVHLLDLPQDAELTPLQNRIVSLLQTRGDLRGKQLDHSLPHMDWRKSLPGLVKKGIALSSPILKPPSVKAKTGRAVKFISMPESDDELKCLGKPGSAPRERRLKALQFLQNESGEVKLPFVYAETGANAADLTSLAEHDFIEFSEVEIQRDPLSHINPVSVKPPQLTAEQASVVEQLIKQIGGLTPNLPNLLQGVTSSGKTEVYLHTVEEALRLGKQAVILVPEISLTPQTVDRFLGRFPGRVGLIHSKLSDGERYDTWRRIRTGEISVVVGARSALFAPLSNLGLIVIDECHDGSYHQEDVEPRYQAVSTAIAYARLTNSVLIMGSATPEVEQRFLFKQNRWNIFELPNRVLAHQALYPDASGAPVTSLPMPDIEVVDMRAELVAGNRSPLSRALQTGITEILERHSQAILFLNRRGSSSYVFCRDCGYVLRCSRCNAPMTYHENESLLICHQCNAKRQMPQKCPQCGSTRIKQFGLGTESLQKMIAEQFPKARLLRWDADTARKKGAHDLIMEHFAQGRADILIGTQMIAKGLDLPNVTLVGVVLADVSLNLPDFRAPERTYQLITQVAGRAGRSSLGGKVILQTFQPDHYAIQKAAAYDFASFEKIELNYRKETGYPPYARLVKIELSHYNVSQLERAAVETGERIRNWLFDKDWEEIVMIGPSPCFYQRTAGRYRWQILLRGQRPVELMRAHPLATWQPAGVEVQITVDPVNLL